MEKEPATRGQSGEQSNLNGGVSLAIGEQIRSSNSVLTGLEVEFPKELFQRKKISWKNLKKDLEQENDDKRLQGILDSISISTARVYIGYHKKRTPVAIDFLRSVLKDKGFSVRPGDIDPIYAAIRDAKIPIKREDSGYRVKKNGREYPQTYAIVIVKHTDRILEALRANPELFARLNNNPVKLAYGPKPDRYPNTTRLVRKGEYVRIGAIISERFGILAHRSNYPDLLTDSPVSVFSTSRGYFCSLEDINILRPFLEQGLRKLGKIK